MKYKHKITGNIATSTYSGSNYKVSIPQNFTIPKWIIENSDEWEKVEEIPVGTKVVDTYPDTKGATYEKLSTGKWKHTWIDNYTISEDSIGENKRFQIVKEEVKKEYEILEIQGYSGTYLLQKDGTVYWYYKNNDTVLYGNKHGKPVEYYLNSEYEHHITKVKRLSDGEIFQIGDKVDFTISKNQVIIEFKLLGNHISVYSNSSQEGLPSISKVKTPIFITEDYVEIYNNSPVYYVNSDYTFGWEGVILNNIFKKQTTGWYFSTREKAEEFILLNKPVLSINDVKENFVISEIENGRKVTNGSLTLEKLKELVKSKL